MTLIDSELKYVLTDITRSGDLCLYSIKPAQTLATLLNSEASASEDTTPIPPRPTLKQKFSSVSPCLVIRALMNPQTDGSYLNDLICVFLL